VTVSPEQLARGAELHPLVFSEVRIENTNHCGYDCFFCPRDKLSRDRGFMPLEDFELVLDRVGSHEGDVDLHGFGEPLLDRRLRDKVALVRERWPAARPRIFSTVGVKVGEGYFEDLVAAGLRRIEISFYGFDRETYRLVHLVDRFDLARRNLIEVCRVRRASPQRLTVVVRAFPSHPTIKQPGGSGGRIREFRAWLDGLGVDVFYERALHNYGDGRDYNTFGEGPPCSVAWGYRRRVLQVTWDLDVIPCCFDSNATVKLGNLRQQSLAEILHGEVYRRFIRSHLEDRLEDYPVCLRCERCHSP
jgi:MoaA/NifB/PqqE/SkfB family radical SAM enzyme